MSSVTTKVFIVREGGGSIRVGNVITEAEVRVAISSIKDGAVDHKPKNTGPSKSQETGSPREPLARLKPC